MDLLEQEGILERIAPEEVLKKYENTIGDAIRTDMLDTEFLQLCDRSGRAEFWTLALAKIPKEIREDPKFKPLDRSMQRLMGDLPGSIELDVSGYDEVYAEAAQNRYRESSVFDETRSSGNRKIEYRYSDYPLPLGESIMVNHALIAGLLHTGATPMTDDAFHNKVLAHKLDRASQIPEVAKILEKRVDKRQLKKAQLAMAALTDVELPLLSPDLPLDAILQYRLDHQSELAEAREVLGTMARKIKGEPWSDDFADEMECTTIPQIQEILDKCHTTRGKWLKSGKGRQALTGLGLAAGGIAAVMTFVATPAAPVALTVVALGLVSGTAIPGLEWLLDWKDGKKSGNENGLHYFLDLKAGHT